MASYSFPLPGSPEDELRVACNRFCIKHRSHEGWVNFAPGEIPVAVKRLSFRHDPVFAVVLTSRGRLLYGVVEHPYWGPTNKTVQIISWMTGDAGGSAGPIEPVGPVCSPTLAIINAFPDFANQCFNTEPDRKKAEARLLQFIRPGCAI